MEPESGQSIYSHTSILMRKFNGSEKGLDNQSLIHTLISYLMREIFLQMNFFAINSTSTASLSNHWLLRTQISCQDRNSVIALWDIY